MRLLPRCHSVPTSLKPAARSASTCVASQPEGDPWCSESSWRRSRRAASPARSGSAAIASHQPVHVSQMTLREAPLLFARDQRLAQPFDDGAGALVALEVVTIEQQAAGPQGRGQFRVHGPERGAGQPVQRGGAHGRVGRAVQAEGGRPARRAQVTVGEPQPRPLPVRGPAQREQQRVGVHRDHRRGGDPVEQPDRQGAGAAAQVQHERVGAAGALLDRVDQRREPVFPVRQVFLLLLIPLGDPLQRRPLVQSRHARLLVTGELAQRCVRAAFRARRPATCRRARPPGGPSPAARRPRCAGSSSTAGRRDRAAARRAPRRTDPPADRSPRPRR